MKTILLGIVCLFLADIQGSEGLRCHKCSGVSDPHFCSMVVTCAADEECHTEEVIGDDSTVFYNSGCMKKKVCELEAKAGRRSELQVCKGCCGKDLCNTELCPANNGSSTMGVQCYRCDEVASPSECHNRVTCADGEICLVQKFVNDNLEEKFSLGCETKSRCDLLKKVGKRTIQLCNECCDTPGCNRHLCFNDTASNSSCVDLPDVDCKMVNSTLDICGKRTLAAIKYCPNFCGYCSDDGTTLAPPTGTTQDPCRDSGVLDCHQMNVSLHICAQKNSPPALMYCPRFCELCTPLCADNPDIDCALANSTQNACATRSLVATTHCPKFCGYCNADGTTNPTPPPAAGTTQDPCRDSGAMDCKSMDDQLHICAQKTSPPTMLYCPKYCGLC